MADSELVSAYLSSAKILKAKKAIKEIGSVAKAAQMLIKYGSISAAKKYGGKALADLCFAITGLDGIQQNCF